MWRRARGLLTGLCFLFYVVGLLAGEYVAAVVFFVVGLLLVHVLRATRRGEVRKRLERIAARSCRSPFQGWPARLEREANVAAAEILMPSEAVREVVARKGPEVLALARVFGVSREAMRLRLGELGLEPSGFVKGGTPSGVHRTLGTRRVRDGSDRALQGHCPEPENP